MDKGRVSAPLWEAPVAEAPPALPDLEAEPLAPDEPVGLDAPAEPEALPLPLAEAVADVDTVRASVYNADEALVTQLDDAAATGV